MKWSLRQVKAFTALNQYSFCTYLSFPVLGGDYVSDHLYVTSGLPTYAQPILSTQLSVYVFYPVFPRSWWLYVRLFGRLGVVDWLETVTAYNRLSVLSCLSPVTVINFSAGDPATILSPFSQV